MSDDAVADQIFAIGPQIRSVAFGSGQHVVLRERPVLADASSSESDRYEELLVNPTLLTLAGQHGDIDCGGLAIWCRRRELLAAGDPDRSLQSCVGGGGVRR
jgi:hypothetical protein